MTERAEFTERQRRTLALVRAYPLGPLLIGIVLNLFVFGVDPSSVALPSTDCVSALIIAAILLAMNHTWIMTSRINNNQETWNIIQKKVVWNMKLSTDGANIV